jgi:cation transport ATPase
MRLRVHGGKGNHRLLQHVKDSISHADGVRHVEVNSTTGSIVVHYRGKGPRQFEDDLRDHGSANDTFDLKPPEVGEAAEAWAAIEREAEFLAAHSELARSVVHETKHLDMAVKRATDNTIDLKVLVPLGLAVASFMYLGSDVATPLWVSLGVFSFNSFVSLHPPLPYPKTKDEVQRRGEY